jgi:hypothetical protein
LMVTFWSLMELQIPYHFNCGTTVQVFWALRLLLGWLTIMTYL